MGISRSSVSNFATVTVGALSPLTSVSLTQNADSHSRNCHFSSEQRGVGIWLCQSPKVANIINTNRVARRPSGGRCMVGGHNKGFGPTIRPKRTAGLFKIAHFLQFSAGNAFCEIDACSHLGMIKRA